MLEFTKPMTWHKTRQTGLGGTDAAAILGIGYLDAKGVYKSKTSEVPIVNEPTERMRHGLFNEGYIAHQYSAKTELELEDAPPIIHHPNQKHRLCSPDKLAKLGKKKRKMVEFKSVYSSPGPEWGEFGSDEVPDGFLVQVLHDLDVALAAGLATEESADLIVNFVGYDTRIYTIDMRGSLMEKIVKVESDFWDLVLSKKSPEKWVHPLAKDISGEIAFSRPGTVKNLGEEAMPFLAMMDEASTKAREAKKIRKEAKFELTKLLDGIETGIFPNGRKCRAKLVQRKGFTVAPTEFLDVRVMKGNSDGGNPATTDEDGDDD